MARKASQIRGNRHDKPHRPYRVSAYNTSKLSENKIHDDAVAKRFGFRGGSSPASM